MEFVIGMLVAKLCMRFSIINTVFKIDLYIDFNIDFNIGGRHGAQNFIDKLVLVISTTKLGAIIGVVAALIQHAWLRLQTRNHINNSLQLFSAACYEAQIRSKPSTRPSLDLAHL